MNTSSSFYDSDTIVSENSMNTNLNRLKGHKNNQTRNSRLIETRTTQIHFSDRICNQFQLLEKFIWDFNEYKNKKNTNEALSELIFRILIQSKNKNSIYDYFRLVGPQKCCTLLMNHSYHDFEQKINFSIASKENITRETHVLYPGNMNPIPERVISIYDEKMLLYYCTICSLYPSLYSRGFPSPLISEGEEDLINENFSESNDGAELETTSEGLGDYVREIFNINRQIFNEYQVKIIKKFLLKKSHPQILKEELQKQYLVVKNDQHPYYDKNNFKSMSCYEAWKERFIYNLENLLRNLHHIPSDDSEINDDKIILKYIEKLNLFPDYYENLVYQIFKNLESNNSYKLTSNSKRLLREFQLRYSVDYFDALIYELKYFTDYFRFEASVFGTFVSYLKDIHLFLTNNTVSNEPQQYSIRMNSLFTLFSILENIHSALVYILKNFKTYFLKANQRDIGNFIELLQEVTNLNEFLNRTTAISTAETVKIYMNEGVKNSYIAMKNTITKSSSSFDSNTVYSLLLFCRDQIIYHQKTLVHPYFRKLNIIDIIVKVLYQNLMEDIKKLCEFHLEELIDNKILNLNLLAISYRIDSFDTDYKAFIACEKQIWRSYMLPQLLNWISSMSHVCCKMISKYFVPSDHYSPIFENPIKNLTDSDLLRQIKDLSSINTQNNSPLITNEHKSAFFHYESSRNNSLKSKIIKNLNESEKIKKTVEISSDQDNVTINYDSVSPKNYGKRESNISRDSYFASSSAHSSPFTFESNNQISLPSFFGASDFKKFPCSSSLVDMMILICRYKDTCENLLNLIIKDSLAIQNSNFFLHRLKIFNAFYQEIFKMLEIYAENLLALDVCAASKKVLDDFFGNEIIEEIAKNNLIWGCRHKLKNCPYDCDHFINKNSIYISEKYEPINKMMSVRANNLKSIKEILKHFYHKYNNVMQKQYNLLIKIKSKKSNLLLQTFKLEIYKTKLIFKCLDTKLEKIQNGLIKLLAFRFNLFCKQAKIFLMLSDELNELLPFIRIKPLTDFLSGNFEMLKSHLYPQLFKKLIKQLWDYFNENIIGLMQKFENKINSNPKQEANSFLKMIEIMILKFKEYYNNHGYLEAKMKQIKLLLFLFSQDTNSLILLYYKVFNFNYQKNSTNENFTNRVDFIHLVRMWKRLKKPFSGRFLTNYLRKNTPFSQNSFNKDDSIKYAQSLLEANYLTVAKVKSKRSKKNNLNENDSFDSSLDADFKISAFDLMNFDKIYLATKLNYYQLNSSTISKLTNNLLFRNVLLNHEIEILYPNHENLIGTKFDEESSLLFDKCIENSVDQEFVVKILWHRIYSEPIAMKFISMRYSNYANNLHLTSIGPHSIFKTNNQTASDYISFFPFF